MRCSQRHKQLSQTFEGICKPKQSCLATMAACTGSTCSHPSAQNQASGRGVLPRSLLQHTLTLSHLALETLQGVRSQKTGLMLSHVPEKRAVLSAWGPSQVRVAFFRTTTQALMPLAPLHTSLATATTTSVSSIVRQRLPAHR